MGVDGLGRERGREGEGRKEGSRDSEREREGSRDSGPWETKGRDRERKGEGERVRVRDSGRERRKREGALCVRALYSSYCTLFHILSHCRRSF